MPPPLFDSPFLSKLEQLHLLSRRIYRGANPASRRSRQTGSSLEFADYRNYTPGDDLRTVDWNVYGRLDRMFVKLFEAEQDLFITILLDASASMHWTPPEGSGRPSKAAYAQRIAAALAYLSLANLDRVNIVPFPAGHGEELGFLRGKESFHAVLQFLRELPAGTGATGSMTEAFRPFARRMKRRGLAIVLSDFLAPDAIDALAFLHQQQFELLAIQVLDPLELDPAPLLAGGDLRLVDSESGISLDTVGDSGFLHRYSTTFAAFRVELEKNCRRRAIGFLPATTDVPFEDLVLKVLRDKQFTR